MSKPNKFYIIAENNIENNEDEGSLEKLKKGNNKKINTKKYKDKNAIKKIQSTEEDNKKTTKKEKTKKALKKSSSKNKKTAPKEKVSKKTAEKKKKIKEVKTGWWDQ